MSEWLKVMLDEIERKQAEAEQACEEEALRRQEAADSVVQSAQVVPPDKSW